MGSRLRVGAGLALASITLLGGLELWAVRTTVRTFVLVEAVQTAAVALVCWALRGIPSRRRTVAVALALVAQVWVTLAASGYLTGNVRNGLLLFTLFSLVTGAALPWGAVAQAAAMLLAAVPVAAAAVTGANPASALAYASVVTTLAGAASVYVAGALEQARVEQETADRDRRADLAALREEVLTGEAADRVAGTLSAAIETPVVLDRLCELTAEVLHGDVVWTFVGDPGTTFACLAAWDRGDSSGRSRRRDRLDVTTLGRWLAGARTTGGAAEVLLDRPLAGASRALVIPLRHGPDVFGVHLIGRRGARAFSASEWRIGESIGHAVVVAVAHAQAMAQLNHAHRVRSQHAVRCEKLRAPIDKVLREADAATDDATGEAVAMWRRIQSAAMRLHALAEDVLDPAPIDGAGAALRLERVDLAASWQRLRDDCRELPWHEGVRLEWTPLPAPVWMETDPGRLTAIVRHLVGNACKFTTAGVVRVTVRRDDLWLRVQVADTGIGIPASTQEVIFGLVPPSPGGTAARSGLHVVRGYARELGGRVALASTPGEGSVFTVTLPVGSDPGTAALDAGRIPVS